MRSLVLFSPLLLLILLIGGQLLHVNLCSIKVYDRKITNQTYDWHGGTYDWDELQANISWEDSYVSFEPDYAQALQDDLDVITEHKANVEKIDWNNHTITTKGYNVNVCILDMSMTVTDTALFSKRAKASLMAYFELTEGDGCEPLYSHVDQKRRFIITDSFAIKGVGTWQFIHNKGYELLYTELTDLATRFAHNFDLRHLYEIQRRSALAVAYHYFYDPIYQYDATLRAQTVSE